MERVHSLIQSANEPIVSAYDGCAAEYSRAGKKREFYECLRYAAGARFAVGLSQIRQRFSQAAKATLLGALAIAVTILQSPDVEAADLKPVAIDMKERFEALLDGIEQHGDAYVPSEYT